MCTAAGVGRIRHEGGDSVASDAQLVQEALRARDHAYVPYSRFSVGAALLDTQGAIWHGCNIENAAYTPTNCAERTAFFKAVSEGSTDFVAIAVVGGAVGRPATRWCAPCGVCRQVMQEFCDPETFRVILGRSPDDLRVILLKDMLPDGFGPQDLRQAFEEEGTVS